MDLSSEKYIFHPPVFPTLTFTVTQCGPSAVCVRPDEMGAGDDMGGQCIIVWIERRDCRAEKENIVIH